MYERDDAHYEAVQEEERELRRLREQEMRRELERLQEETMREEDRWREEHERIMELRYFCDRSGHRLEATDSGTSCKCGQESVEVFFV